MRCSLTLRSIMPNVHLIDELDGAPPGDRLELQLPASLSIDPVVGMRHDNCAAEEQLVQVPPWLRIILTRVASRVSCTEPALTTET